MFEAGLLMGKSEKDKGENPKKPAKKLSLLKPAAVFGAAALLLAAEGGAVDAQAKDKIKPEMIGREKIRGVVEQNKLTEEMILEKLKTIGKEGKMGNTPTKMWMAPDGRTVIAGYDKKGQSKWLMLENADSSFRRIDYNANGTAEREITNNENNGKVGKTKINNELSSTSMEFLAAQAKISSQAKREKIKVSSFEVIGGKRVRKSVDFESGKPETESGLEEVRRMDEEIQRLFGQGLDQIEAEMEKDR